jgi:Mn-dependent DtxR family transcriptional regulator
MTTEEAKRSMGYGSIVRNLLALRDEVRETSHEEAEAIERIVSDVMALQVHDGYVSQKSIANTRN